LATLAARARSDTLSIQGVILAAMLIGALGVLADTAVTQASAVMALRRAAPALDVRRLYREAFVVGRDHLTATIHTLVLAYAGASLPLLLVLRSSGTPTGDALNGQSVAEPIVATLVGCFALIAAVPLTTALAAALVARIPAETLPDAHHH
ncbi:MAG: YibE/F family protein, partial [Thermoleophilaceae bacterium]|nr:YibE/F family protein [Thermoleophilaceae bacterium]